MSHLQQEIYWPDWMTVRREVPQILQRLQVGELPIQIRTHIIDEGHAFGPMNDIMRIIHIAKNGRMLDTSEKFYI
jgi:hypothetical protein